MKAIYHIKASLLALAAMVACTEFEILEESQNSIDNGLIQELSITGKDFIFDGETRSSVTIGESGASFTWDEDDVIGIFPDKGDQVSFAMDEGAGTQTATFSGGGWALKSSSTYAAYYPHVYENRDMTAIPVSYVGQTQNGNGNIDHIGAYDFMAAGVSTPENGAVAFDMQHLGALVQLTITVPEPSTLTKMVLTSSTEFTETGTIDLTAETPAIIADTQSNTFEIALNDIATTEANENVTVYFMTAPVDLTDSELTIMAHFADESTCEVELTGKNLQAGKAYKLSAELKETIPYSQILYTYSGENGFTPTRNQAFLDVDGKMLTYTNEYANGTGVITFNGILTTLGQNAFYNNSNLTSVTIPDGVTTIEGGAFAYCSNLTNITLPNSVATIKMEAIEGCPSISQFDGKFSTADGYCLIADDTLIAFAAKCGATEYTLPENVTNIGKIAFKDCRTLESITIPNSVTAIESSAFYCCSNLKNINIGNGVINIGDYAFGACTSLTSITIPNNVIEIGTGAFSGCDNIREFRGKHATNDGYALIVDGTLNAFAPACGATQYSIPDNVTEIGYAAFYKCESLTSITIPSCVTTIGSNAFSFCGLKVVYCNATTPPYIGYNSIFSLDSDSKIYVYEECVDIYKSTWSSYSRYIYENGSCPDNTTTTIYYTTSDGQTITSDKLSIKSNTYNNNQGKMVIYGNLGHIPDKAFNQCSNLTSITIPNTVTVIRTSAFSDCQNLTSVTIGNGVINIETNAFYCCDKLSSVTLGESLTTIGEQAFQGCSSLASIVIPNSVTTIGNGAFRFCSGLTSVTMGNSVTSIGVAAFQGCNSLTEFKGKHASVDGRSLIVDNTIICYANASGTEYTIPNEVVSIGNQAFATCDKLTSITIPETVTTIEGYAFVYCLSLTEVSIPKNVTIINYGAFNNCSLLATVKVEATTPPTLYDNNTFSGCSNDLKVYVPTGSVSAYMSTDYWKNLTILSDTE